MSEEMKEVDITGVVFTVSKGGGGSYKKLQLAEDEWYPTKLIKISKVNRPASKDGKFKASEGLDWIFELQGEDFSYEFDGKVVQQRITGKTSLIFSSNPERPSKFYVWYCKLSGRVPVEGEQITLKDLIGMDVQIMAKGNPGKDKQGNDVTWYNVERVKGSNGVKKTASVTPTQEVKKQVVEKEEVKKVVPNETKVATPSDISDDAVGVDATEESEGDLYKDVY